jgi:hypothetical protein
MTAVHRGKDSGVGLQIFINACPPKKRFTNVVGSFVNLLTAKIEHFVAILQYMSHVTIPTEWFNPITARVFASQPRNAPGCVCLSLPFPPFGTLVSEVGFLLEKQFMPNFILSPTIFVYVVFLLTQSQTNAGIDLPFECLCMQFGDYSS